MDEPYEVNDEQFASVSALEGRQRFEQLLKRICDTEIVFLLVEDGDLFVLTDESGSPPQLPVWPHPRYVEAYRASIGGGAGCAPMELTEFVDSLLPDLALEEAEIVVMPTEQGRVVGIAPDELRRAIISYHDEWYGGWPK